MKAYVRAERVEHVHGGADYFSRLLRLIEDARQTLHLQVYIFADDDTGREVAEALMRAAQRGVSVWVMADGFGSSALPGPFVERLRASGVHFRFFKHIVSLWHWQGGRTLHQKVAVVDAYRALVGGINVADKYRGTATEPPWLDFAVYIEGEVCRHLHDLCADIYHHQYWRRRWPRRSPPVAWLPPPPREGLVRFRLNDWLRRKSEVFQSYLQGLRYARRSLTIVASYFLPGPSVNRRLVRAVRRGVHVRLLLTGPSDVPPLKWAERYLAYQLVRKGVRVFLWEHSVMHGKAIVVDDVWASVGSFNLNPLSRFRSLELNVDIADPAFVHTFSAHIDTLLDQYCTEITPEQLPELAHRWERLKAAVAYYLAAFAMRVLFSPKSRREA